MSLEGLAKFEKNTVWAEIPPTPNDHGDIVEVQVLEEGEIPRKEEEVEVQVAVFDPEEFLARLDEFQPHCPRCKVRMTYGSVPCPDGKTFEYYRCPSARFYTKCYVTCGVKEVGDYLRRVEKQTHPCYKEIDPARFRCDCNKSLVLATSHSINNPDRLYLKCAKRTCGFFQWIDEPPGVWLKTFSLTDNVKDFFQEL